MQWQGYQTPLIPDMDDKAVFRIYEGLEKVVPSMFAKNRSILNMVVMMPGGMWKQMKWIWQRTL